MVYVASQSRPLGSGIDSCAQRPQHPDTHASPAGIPWLCAAHVKAATATLHGMYQGLLVEPASCVRLKLPLRDCFTAEAVPGHPHTLTCLPNIK